LAEKKTPIDAALELAIDNSEIIKRLSGRRTCRGCGKVFPGQLDKCDACGGEVYQRDDDKEDVIARRLEVYAEQTAPIIAFYRHEGLLITIPAVGKVDEITASAIRALAQKLS
jgi:adenylate kinase